MIQNKMRDSVLTMLCIALAGVFLFWAEGNLDSYQQQILSLIAINAILALSLNLIYGFTGMFSLGHAGFMAIGAYVCTLLILTPAQKVSMWRLGPILPFLKELSLPFFPAVIVAGLVAAFLGLLIALPVLRLGGDYLGIATLGFAEIIRVVIINAQPVTNGSLGLLGIPQYATLTCNFGWLLFTLYIIVTILRSNTGNIFRAIRDDEIAARTMGVNTFFYRVLSFTIGAFFAGIGGALTATLISTIDPKMFMFTLTFNVLMIVVAGGLGSITGSLIGSFVITILLEALRVVESPFDIGIWSTDGIPGLRMVIFSLLLLFIILYRPSGLMGKKEFSFGSIFNKRRANND